MQLFLQVLGVNFIKILTHTTGGSNVVGNVTSDGSDCGGSSSADGLNEWRRPNPIASSGRSNDVVDW